MIVPSMPRNGRRQVGAAITALLCMTFAFAASAADPPAVSSDGLHLVKHTKFAVVYVKPGASLKAYDKFALLDCFVSFRKGWREDMEDDSTNMISDADIKRIETELAARFKEVFEKELEAGGFQLSADAAADVLVLRPAIINLDMEAPPNDWDPTEQTYSSSAGQMTLYLELYDSLTSTLLARVIDPEAASNYGVFTWQSQAGNIAAADGIMKKWSDTLRGYMEAARSSGG